MADKDSFYVGYMPKAPEPLGRWLRPKIALLLVIVGTVAALVAASQSPMGPGTFEFGQYQTFEGVIHTSPYPMLRVERPGETGQKPDHSLYYLGVFGKQGAAQAAQGFDGKKVRLQGALIYRDNQVMIELKDDSIESLGDAPPPSADELGTLTVHGEIVDSKCFLGVMKPGNLKTHKACAVRCIAGGIPPVLLVRDAQGLAHYLTLVDAAGQPVNEQVLDMVAQPLTITGKLSRLDNLYILAANPQDYKLIH